METDCAGGRKSGEGWIDGSSTACGWDVLFLLCCGPSTRAKAQNTYLVNEGKHHFVGHDHGWLLNEVQKEFYAELATELIDNNYDTVGSVMKRKTRSNNIEDSDDDMPVITLVTGQPRCGMSAHLTPTKSRRCGRGGNVLPYSLQGRCRICQKKTTFQCSWCVDDPNIDDEGWICMTKNGKLFPNTPR